MEELQRCDIKVGQNLKVKKIAENKTYKGYVTYANESCFTIKTEHYSISFMYAEIKDNEIEVSKAK